MGEKKKERNHKFFISNNTLTVKAWYVIGGALLVFTVVFAIAFLVMTERSRRDYEIRESETVLNSMSGNITANLQSYKDITRLVMLNNQVVRFLRAKSDEVDAGLKNDTKFGINDIFVASDYVDSVFIFRDDKHYVTTGKGVYYIDYNLMGDSFWQAVIQVKEGGTVIFMNGNKAVYRANGDPIITIGRAIYDIHSQERVGILLVNISTGMLQSTIQGQVGSDVCVVTEEGKLLAGSEEVASLYSDDFANAEGMVHRAVRGDKNVRMISALRVPDTPLIVLCASNASSPETIPMETMIAMLLLFVTFLASISVAAVFITKNITHPIYELSEEIEKTKEAGWLKKIDAEMPDNELSMLKESYNSMIDYLNEMFTRLLDKEKVIQKAEMRVLHEQIKPHFLYNSLETISYMALEAKAPNVHSALETLGSFYRNFLSKGDREIPLEREINIVKDYLSLQKLRYGDILNDEYDISEETKECQIPKLILQPLVENSIYHGIRLTGEKGIIKVSSWLEDNKLHITVWDTGIGMTQDTIESVLKIDDHPASLDDNLSGFGLKGTIERIRYYCGRDDVVKIKSELGEYTQIELILPLEEKG
ncbi:MAG: histidine kinase [Lachnospiraceae bacterium]|nr:histidine kinase [Lachnospiraceae bacterium]